MLFSPFYLERGAKPVTNFVKNLSALSDWYSIYTSAIAFIVSYSIPPGVVRTFKMYYLLKFIETTKSEWGCATF